MQPRRSTSLRGSALVALACLTPTHALGAPAPMVLAFEVEGGGQTEALAWRDGEAISVSPNLFAALGLKTPDGAADTVLLSSLPGLRYRLDEARAAVVITCAPQCFPLHQIAMRAPAKAEGLQGVPLRGLIVNYDIVGNDLGGAQSASGLFETVWAAPNVAIENAFVARDDHGLGITRLDTALTIDMPAKHMRLRVGDNTTSPGAWGAQTRFGGIRFGTDFSLDPAFVTFPTPSLNGQSAAPAAADLYVDNALRYSQNVPAGPFSVVDAPMISGAGVAQLVVTDVLGRQQIISAPFYASPVLLRPRLMDFAIVVGAERLNFGQKSARYDDDIAAVTVRRGFDSGLTGEVRAEAGARSSAFGVALSGASYALGRSTSRSQAA